MCHFTPIRLAKSKMPKSKALMRMWTLTYFWWECKIIRLLCKAILLHLFVGNFLVIPPDPLSLPRLSPSVADPIWNVSQVLWLLFGSN